MTFALDVEMLAQMSNKNKKNNFKNEIFLEKTFYFKNFEKRKK